MGVGRAAGRAETRRAAVSQVFRTRGLPVSAALPRRLTELEGVSTAALVQAALECRDESHFLRLAGRSGSGSLMREKRPPGAPPEPKTETRTVRLELM